jgi:hypothetical protein
MPSCKTSTQNAGWIVRIFFWSSIRKGRFSEGSLMSHTDKTKLPRGSDQLSEGEGSE